MTDRAARPQVTIGLPVFNGAAYVGEAIDCVLQQSVDDLELVISDNCSTDETEEICRDYASTDPRIRYSRCPENLGASYNFNRVLDLAEGRYLRWLGADDVFAPRFVERCVDALDLHPDAALVYPGSAFMSVDGLLLAHSDELDMPVWSDDDCLRARQMFDAVFRDGRIANVVVFGLIRTDVLRSVRRLGNFFASDRTLVAELALAGDIIEIPETLSFFRRHDESSSGAPADRWKQIQQAFYDPRISGRLREEFQFRRHYLESFRAISHADLGRGDQLRVATGLAGISSKYVLTSLGRHLGLLERPEHRSTPEPDAPHWRSMIVDDLAAS